MVASLYIANCFSLAAFKILSLSHFQQFNFNVTQCESFELLLLGTVWTSWIWCLFLSSGQGSFQSLFLCVSILSLSFLLLLVPSPVINVLVYLMVYHKFLKLSSLFFILFCFSDWINFIALSSHSLILFSESSGLLLISLLNFLQLLYSSAL